MGGSKGLHGLVDGFDERQHGLLQLALELWFMRLKPLPAVISLQAAQEFEAGFTKVRFAGDAWAAGQPCQIEGGKQSLPNNYRNTLCCGVACPLLLYFKTGFRVYPAELLS